MDSYINSKMFKNSIYGQILKDVIESENNDALRNAVSEFIDNTTQLKPIDYNTKRIWMGAVANHAAIQCRDLSLKDKTEMLDDFRKLLFAK